MHRQQSLTERSTDNRSFLLVNLMQCFLVPDLHRLAQLDSRVLRSMFRQKWQCFLQIGEQLICLLCKQLRNYLQEKERVKGTCNKIHLASLLSSLTKITAYTSTNVMMHCPIKKLVCLQNNLHLQQHYKRHAISYKSHVIFWQPKLPSVIAETM